VERLFLVTILTASVVAVIGCAVDVARGPVSRGRLERFARRQLLQITPGNGNHVIRYLASTRRWRVAGLVGGILVSSTWYAATEGFRIDFLTLLAGWFAGALVAEVAMARRSLGQRRTASLEPRLPGAYLPRTAWAFPAVAAALSVAVATATAIAAALDRAEPSWAAAFWAVVALAVAVTVRAAQGYVLRRPQPLADPDVLAADDAIRSRSLHVLSGGGAALILYCVLGQFGSAHSTFGGGVDQAVAAAATVTLFAAPALGWIVATAAWRVRRPEGSTPVGGVVSA